MLFVVGILQVSDITPTYPGDENNSGVEIQATRDAKVTHELDTVFDCLRSARSRYLLYYLSDKIATVTSVEEAVEAVQEYEAATMETVALPERQSVRMDLINSHLPRLQAAGILSHSPQHGEVHFDGIPLLEEWLERSRQLELD